MYKPGRGNGIAVLTPCCACSFIALCDFMLLAACLLTALALAGAAVAIQAHLAGVRSARAAWYQATSAESDRSCCCIRLRPRRAGAAIGDGEPRCARLCRADSQRTGSNVRSASFQAFLVSNERVGQLARMFLET